MTVKINDRVGAVSHVAGKKIKLIGYGVYVGNEHSPAAGPGEQPKIALDWGGSAIVCGCGCSLWGHEEEIDKIVKTCRNEGADFVCCSPLFAMQHSAKESGIS